MAQYCGIFDKYYSQRSEDRGDKLCPAQALLTRGAFADHDRYTTLRDAFLEMLGSNILPIVNTNDLLYTERLDVFSDNDHLASYIAAMIDADVLILLTDVAGLYTKNPKLYPDARRIDRVDETTWSEIDVDDSVSSSGGMRSKIDAMHLMEALGTTCWIVKARENNSLIRALENDDTSVGTVLETNHRSKVKNFGKWLVAGASPIGTLIVSDVGSQSMCNRSKRASLLAIGVQQIAGEFPKDSILAIRDDEFKLLGLGRTRFSSDQLRQITEAQRRDDVVVVHADYFSPCDPLFANNERAAVLASVNRLRQRGFMCTYSRKDKTYEILHRDPGQKNIRVIFQSSGSPEENAQVLRLAVSAKNTLSLNLDDWLLFSLAGRFDRWVPDAEEAGTADPDQPSGIISTELEDRKEITGTAGASPEDTSSS